MSEQSFDPYHKWLGVPPEERPINHYRLLGIDLFETSLDVIDTLSMRQISHVRTFAHGPYAELSQQILNQLNEARSVLLNEKDKGVYDTELRKRLQKNKVNGPTNDPAITEKQSKESGRDFAKLQKYEETLREREKQLDKKKLEAEQRLSAVLRTLNTQREDALREVEAKQKEFTQKKEVFEQERIKERARIEEQEVKVESQLEPSPNFSDAGILTTHDAVIDIDSSSVSRIKAQGRGSQRLSQRTSVGLIVGSILIISAALLWGLILFGKSSYEVINDPPPLAVAPFDAQQAKAHQEAWAEYLELPKTMINSLGMEFVLIPPGQFETGVVGDGQDLAGPFKVTQRQVLIDRPYYISTTEITESQAMKLGWEDPAPEEQQTGLPACEIHWHDAIRLLNKLSTLEGLAANYLLDDGIIIDQPDKYGYRLPSSDEWEFASRAGTATRYFFGDEPNQIEEYSSIKSLIPVASGKANPFGLYDVHGNASEWVQQNGSHEWKDNDGSHMQEMRGVSTPNAPQHAGNDFKNWHKRGNQWRNLGFRVVLEISDLPMKKLSPKVDPQTGAVTMDRSNLKSGEETVETNGNQVDPPKANSPLDETNAKSSQKAWANHLGVPVEYTNAIGMKFALIPPGSFLMGSSESELNGLLKKGRQQIRSDLFPSFEASISATSPKRYVVITKAFYMSIFETTRGEFTAVIDSKSSSDRLPRSDVSWNDAAEFCKRLTMKSKIQGQYRLPTSAEWEFACRAGTSKLVYFDEKTDAASDHHTRLLSRPPNVGSKKANSWGLHDMYGSLGEWVNDWGWSGSLDLTAGSDPFGPKQGSSKVIRGCGWNSVPVAVQSVERSSAAPDYSGSNVGFRVALDVLAVKAALEKP